MAQEPAHVELLEFKQENIQYMNWMFEDLFCLYGTNIPYFLLEFEFPQYPRIPYGFSGYDFNIEWGPWGYWLPWFNYLLGFLFDEAHLPQWQMPDFSDASWDEFNRNITILYDNVQRHDWYDQVGTFTKDEVVEGEDSGVTGYYKWKDSDDHIYIANKEDSSGDPIADFDEEKVTGATSAAYAYTYAAPGTTKVYHAFTGLGIGLLRRGRSRTPDGYPEAWDVYDANGDANPPTYRFESAGATGPFWGTYDEIITPGDFFYYATARQTMLEFDTSDVDSERLSAITLHIDVEDFDDGISTPIVKFYKRTGRYEYPEESYDDWNDVTNFVAEQEVSDTTTYDIVLSADDINFEGSTFYKVRLAETDVTQPSTEAINKVLFRSIATYIWIEFTY